MTCKLILKKKKMDFIDVADSLKDNFACDQCEKYINEWKGQIKR